MKFPAILLISALLVSCAPETDDDTILISETLVGTELPYRTAPIDQETESDISETDPIPETLPGSSETEPESDETLLPDSESVPEPVSEEPAYTAVHEYFIDTAEHPELDFTYHDEYQNYAICDFAIAPSGNLLLLTLSEGVSEYTPDGKLVGQYKYNFAGQGLTAYMLTCDTDGNFYFADGRNDLIIKANREGILGVSTVGADAGLYALTLTESIAAVEENVIDFLNYNDNFEFCVYRVDVSGETASCPDGGVLGQSLGGGLYAVVEMVCDENGDRTESFRMTLVESDGTAEIYDFTSMHPTGTAVYGLGLYGIMNGDIIAGYVREWYLDENGREKSTDNRVLIRRGEGIVEVCANDLNNYKLTRTYGGETYVLQRHENVLRIVPLSVLIEESPWTDGHWFETVVH